MRLEFVVPPEKDGWCVRDFLRWCGVSTTALRAAKRTPPGILADGAPVYANAPLRAGARLLLPTVPDPPPALAPQPLPLGIVCESAAAVVLEKPAGLAVHPTLTHPDGTLANVWLGELARRGQTGAFHPVWRLDKDTSGLLLLAKNAAAQPFLQRSCRKLYAAVLCGCPPQAGPGWQLVDAPIARAGDSIIRRRVAADGAAARTYYRVLAVGDGCCLALFSLATGRTHQIRVHMAHLGCPVAGDGLYGSADPRFPRQALHCVAAAFYAPLAADGDHLFPPPADGVLSALGAAVPPADGALLAGGVALTAPLPMPPAGAVPPIAKTAPPPLDAALPPAEVDPSVAASSALQVRWGPVLHSGGSFCGCRVYSPFPPQLLAAAGLGQAAEALQAACAALAPGAVQPGTDIFEDEE